MLMNGVGPIFTQRVKIGPTPFLVVVSGHTRGIGKTAAVEHLLRLRRGEPWVAVKISAHRHAPDDQAVPVLEEALDPSPLTQTGRYLAAGARRAWLCRCPAPALPEAARLIRHLITAGWHVIVESNRIVPLVEPDVRLFVLAPASPDWKASAPACFKAADAVIVSAAGSDQPLRLPPGEEGHRRPVFRFTPAWGVPGLEGWLDDALSRRTDVALSPFAIRHSPFVIRHSS